MTRMARGFESKSVEAQQEEAARGKIARPSNQMTPEQRPCEQRRRALELTRTRACDDLSRASAPAHRRMLEEAIAALDQQLDRSRDPESTRPYSSVCILLPPHGRTMRSARNVVRIAAIGDLHYSRNAVAGSLQPLLSQINESADILVICGDLTDYGLAEEARALARELTVAQDSHRRRARQPRLRVVAAGRDASDPHRCRCHVSRRRQHRDPRHRIRRRQRIRRRLRAARARAVGRGHHQEVRARSGRRSAEARVSARAACATTSGSPSCTTRRFRRPSKANRSRFSRSLDAAGSKNRSAATRSPPCFMATRITDALKGGRRKAFRCSTCRCR